MPSVEGNNNAAPLNEYEQRKLANVERNKKRLADIKLRETLNDMAQLGQPKKVAKANPKKRSASTAIMDPPNLRPRPRRNYAQPEEERVLAELNPVGDFLGNNEDLHNDNPSNGAQKKRKGRGITKKDEIFARKPDMPKIIILVNDRGQPVGKNARELSSVTGCQVRRKLSLASLDWRLVDAGKKYELWTELKNIYDISEDAYNWVMRTAGKKWKEFKATIKELYFKADMTLEEVGESPDNRINDADWKFLVEYWMSDEFQIRSERAKMNRSKLELHHTSGSVSFACSEHELAMELGRPPRRDENFIKTHTRKNGVPSKQAEPIINELKEIVEARPELKERTIQQGDAFAAVCGEKEPRGYVRVLGLGPTPQDIGTPALKCYAPTRLTMEIFARKKVESEKAALQQNYNHLQARISVIEQRMEQDRASEEPMSQHGSTSLHNEIRDAGLDEDEGDASGDDEFYYDDNTNFHSQVYGAAQSRPTPRSNDCSQVYGAAQSRPAPRSNDAPRSDHDALVGKDVILYALLRPDRPVAKGTIISTKPSTILGGKALGREFCEVIVTSVLKRDEILPRPCADMDTMTDAHIMSIAWPYKKLKINSHPSAPPTASGSAVRIAAV